MNKQLNINLSMIFMAAFHTLEAVGEGRLALPTRTKSNQVPKPSAVSPVCNLHNPVASVVVIVKLCSVQLLKAASGSLQEGEYGNGPTTFVILQTRNP